MVFLKEITDTITIVLVICLIFFAVLDNILIRLIKHRKPLLDNKYFDFHRRYGFFKITLLKLLAVLYIIYAMLKPTISSGKLAAPILAYGIFVITLLIDFIRK